MDPLALEPNNRAVNSPPVMTWDSVMARMSPSASLVSRTFISGSSPASSLQVEEMQHLAVKLLHAHA